MFPVQWFPTNYWAPQYWVKGGASAIVSQGAGGGQIFDFESLYPTDQMLDFPDYVYSIPPAQTQPVEETTILVGSSAGTAIQIRGTIDPE